jgi:hypothetical protein
MDTSDNRLGHEVVEVQSTVFASTLIWSAMACAAAVAQLADAVHALALSQLPKPAVIVVFSVPDGIGAAVVYAVWFLGFGRTQMQIEPGAQLPSCTVSLFRMSKQNSFGKLGHSGDDEHPCALKFPAVVPEPPSPLNGGAVQDSGARDVDCEAILARAQTQLPAAGHLSLPFRVSMFARFTQSAAVGRSGQSRETSHVTTGREAPPGSSVPGAGDVDCEAILARAQTQLPAAGHLSLPFRVSMFARFTQFAAVGLSGQSRETSHVTTGTKREDPPGSSDVDCEGILGRAQTQMPAAGHLSLPFRVRLFSRFTQFAAVGWSGQS